MGDPMRYGWKGSEHGILHASAVGVGHLDQNAMSHSGNGDGDDDNRRAGGE